MCSNPAFEDGPWFDYMSTNLVDASGTQHQSPGRVELMYFLTLTPDAQYTVVHPVFQHKFAHLVLTSWYRMEYMDDPHCIMDCNHTMDWETKNST